MTKPFGASNRVTDSVAHSAGTTVPASPFVHPSTSRPASGASRALHHARPTPRSPPDALALCWLRLVPAPPSTLPLVHRHLKSTLRPRPLIVPDHESHRRPHLEPAKEVYVNA